ncbi:endonuclease/exonuclease/phosphatase family protein [Aquimarina sediminis]|uniref:endonuclease/exonuclease/phosphatase family protein n=1 Tax=Aquimarina sediminis TaxID=2070536 RepID=UPI001F4E193E|nr:endonuclease/exonuclease/phosphatase family protein [Aquimarina sediminis]
MKYLITILFAIATNLNSNGQISVMSLNIRYDNPEDKENGWESRKTDIKDMLQYYLPDFFGIQEGLNNQVNYLDQELLQYKYIGVGRDDGNIKGEYTAIYYDTTKHKLVKSNTYWLSKTPNTVSVGWDASMERIVTYGAFMNKKAKDTLHIFNAHYDHMGDLARAESSKLILDLIAKKKLQNKTVIVMGDLNSIPTDTPITLLKTELSDAFETSKSPPYGPIGTFNQFNSNVIPKKRIDYIFTKNITVIKYRNINDKRKNNLYLSDHLPIMIEIEND